MSSENAMKGMAWSLVDGSDDELPTLEIDPDGDLTSWEEAMDALIDALMGVVSEAESRREDAQDWEQEASEELARIEGMDEKAFMAAYGPEPNTADQRPEENCEAQVVPRKSAIEAQDTTSAQPEGRRDTTFRAQWCGHVEIEARSREEALGIHEKMNAEEILGQLIFDGIEE